MSNKRANHGGRSHCRVAPPTPDLSPFWWEKHQNRDRSGGKFIYSTLKVGESFKSSQTSSLPFSAVHPTQPASDFRRSCRFSPRSFLHRKVLWCSKGWPKVAHFPLVSLRTLSWIFPTEEAALTVKENMVGCENKERESPDPAWETYWCLWNPFRHIQTTICRKYKLVGEKCLFLSPQSSEEKPAIQPQTFPKGDHY